MNVDKMYRQLARSYPDMKVLEIDKLGDQTDWQHRYNDFLEQFNRMMNIKHKQYFVIETSITDDVRNPHTARIIVRARVIDTLED